MQRFHIIRLLKASIRRKKYENTVVEKIRENAVFLRYETGESFNLMKKSKKCENSVVAADTPQNILRFFVANFDGD